MCAILTKKLNEREKSSWDTYETIELMRILRARGILREIALKRSLRMQNIGTQQLHERIFQSARDTNRTIGLKSMV